ncbi:VOC family protein [Hydrogenophaga sp.]|uniref:VOC family protein n=1 Tax=Hydrogenophaga sp. TaxID=1904254 RepID=UPI0035B2E68E
MQTFARDPIQPAAAREPLLPADNPLGLEGIEFIEYASRAPQALGLALERMGFRLVARHRSRQVLLYRQGGMNVIVNAHPGAMPMVNAPSGDSALVAIGLRVHDAGQAYRRAAELGAWTVPAQIEPMELYIPSIHGVGASRIYFVDRWREFSIFDVDFTAVPRVDQHPPAIGGLHWFGVVQYIGNDRMADWTEFYTRLFGFEPLPDDERFGLLPKGRVLRSPCQGFYLQLVEPDLSELDPDGIEYLARVAFGVPDVLACVNALRAEGMAFVESQALQSSARGAVTSSHGGGAIFELVHHTKAGVAA